MGDMDNEQLTKSYDLNIVNEEGYGNDKNWVIEIYEFRLEVNRQNPEYSQEFSYNRKEDGRIMLTQEEATALSLGSSEGYSDKDYFWVDTDNFFDFYKDITERVLDILSNLPEYKMEVVFG